MLFLVTILWLIELGISAWSHSLSLLADAGHLLSDGGTLLISLIACQIAAKPASGRATFGYGRLEVLAALINGVGLVAIALLIGWQAVSRLQSPQAVLSMPMLLGAGLGLLVNGVNLRLLHQHSQSDLNLKGAFLHVAADAASSVGLLVAALTLYWFHWAWVDAAASLLIAGLTAVSAIPLIRNSLEILLDYAPANLMPASVTNALTAVPQVCRVESLRIWTIAPGHIGLCAQLTVDVQTVQERDRLLILLQRMLQQEFGIPEATLQMKHGGGDRDLHPLFQRDLMTLIPTESVF